MKVLVACEFSGVVREAFNALAGVEAMSCDLLPAEDGRTDYHYQGDVRDILGDGWDLMIAHPTRIRKPDQTIQPWMFGHDASKATCLWLKDLPLLVPTNILPGGRKARRANQTASGQNKLTPGPDRWKLRSITYPGIAAAMAAQWGPGGSLV